MKAALIGEKYTIVEYNPIQYKGFKRIYILRRPGLPNVRRDFDVLTDSKPSLETIEGTLAFFGIEAINNEVL